MSLLQLTLEYAVSLFDLLFYINLPVLLLQHIYFWFISSSYLICIFLFLRFSLFLPLFFSLSSPFSSFIICLSLFSLLPFSPFPPFFSLFLFLFRFSVSSVLSFHSLFYSTFVAFQAIVVHTNLIQRKQLLKTPCSHVCQPNNKLIF